MRRKATTLAALTLALAGWAGAPADAATSTGTHRTTVSQARRLEALRFWTPARMRAARDVTAAAPSGAAPAAAPATGGREVRVPPVAASAAGAGRQAPAGAVSPASAPAPWTGGGLIGTTEGKVFFQNAAGGTYACSATVANSDNKSVVLSAGHCVVDASTGEVYRNWVFIPGYANGNRPFGTFTATSLYHLDQYVSTGGNANWDFAFARVGQVSGRTLVDTVGAQGIAFNSPTGAHVHSFGYGGSDAEGNGERLNTCEGDEFPDAGREGSTMWGIDCVQSGGSSGGGFLSGFDTAAGSGYLVGNISVSAGSNEYHPVLGDEALDLYRQAGAA